MRDFFSECGTWGIMEGDCLERLQELPEGCADLVLIDPPYGTIKGLDLHNWTAETTAWDDALEAGELMRNCARLLRRNGRAVVFSQEPYSSQLGIRAWDNLAFNYRMIWKKNTFGNGKSAKKVPVSYYEDILVFTQKYDLGVNLHPLRAYYRELARFLQDPDYLRIHARWTASGFKKKETPSVDRIDPRVPYLLENIRIVSWPENHAKGVTTDRELGTVDPATWSPGECSGNAGVSAADDSGTLDVIPEDEEIPDWL